MCAGHIDGDGNWSGEMSITSRMLGFYSITRTFRAEGLRRHFEWVEVKDGLAAERHTISFTSPTQGTMSDAQGNLLGTVSIDSATGAYSTTTMLPYKMTLVFERVE